MNSHFPAELTEPNFTQYISRRWADVAFFNESHPDHDGFALVTLSHWMKNSTRFRHVPTGTWRGGLEGVRWNIALLSCLVSSLTSVDLRLAVPADIQAVHDEAFQKRSWRQIQQIGDWLSRSLQQSIDVLSKTSTHRAEAWKQEVLREYERSQSVGTYARSSRASSSLPCTHGVPTDATELHAYAQKLIQTGTTLEPLRSEGEDTPNIPSALSDARDNHLFPAAIMSGKGKAKKPRRLGSESEEEYNLDDISSSSSDPVLSSSTEGSNHSLSENGTILSFPSVT